MSVIVSFKFGSIFFEFYKFEPPIEACSWLDGKNNKGHNVLFSIFAAMVHEHSPELFHPCPYAVRILKVQDSQHSI